LIEYLRHPETEAWRTVAAAAVLAGIAEAGAGAPAADHLSELTRALLEDPGALDSPIPSFEEAGGPLKAGVHRGEALPGLSVGTGDACRSLDPNGIAAVVRLDDRAHCRAGQGFRETWRGFLASLNLLQNLPNVAFVTSEGILSFGPGAHV